MKKFDKRERRHAINIPMQHHATPCEAKQTAQPVTGFHGRGAMRKFKRAQNAALGLHEQYINECSLSEKIGVPRKMDYETFATCRVKKCFREKIEKPKRYRLGNITPYSNRFMRGVEGV